MAVPVVFSALVMNRAQVGIAVLRKLPQVELFAYRIRYRVLDEPPDAKAYKQQKFMSKEHLCKPKGRGVQLQVRMRGRGP